MTSSWHELMENDGRIPEWPYPIRYEQEQEIETDILVIGGGSCLINFRYGQVM